MGIWDFIDADELEGGEYAGEHLAGICIPELEGLTIITAPDEPEVETDDVLFDVEPDDDLQIHVDDFDGRYEGCDGNDRESLWGLHS